MAINKFNAVAGFSVGGNVVFDVIDSAAKVSANGLTVTGVANLGNVSNVRIAGGTAGYVLSTDGSGNLSWVTNDSGVAGSNTQIQFNNNGVFGGDANLTFNVTTDTLSTKNIALESTGSLTGGNLISANFVTGTLTTSSQPNITSLGTLSTLSVTGNITSGNATLGNSVTANYFTGNFYGTANSATTANTAATVTTAAQPNITSLGTLTALTVNGTANLGSISNVKITGGAAGEVITTDGLGNLVFSSAGGSGFVSITKDAFTGNGVQTQFNLTATPNSEDAIVVNLNGLIQTDAVYSLSGSTVTFTTPPPANSIIEITAYGVINVTAGNTQVAFINGNALSGSNSFTFNQSNSTLAVTGNVSAGNVLTDNLKYANGSPYVFTTNAAGSNTQVQFNDSNAFAGSANFTFNKSTNTLSVTNIVANGAGLTSVPGGNVTGTVANATFATNAGTVTANAQPNITSVGTLAGLTGTGNVNFTGASNVSLGAIGNVKITGGTNGQYLTTDGSGNLSFTTLNISSSSISNGNSNVNIPAANGNVNISAVGNANVVVVTGTGVNVAGTLNATGNANVGNLGATGVVATTLTGTLTTNAQPNVTSVGTLTGLTSTGNINFTSASNVSLGAVGNVKITGGSNGQFVTTDGSGNLSFVTPSSISNGSSNVNIPTANGNITMGVSGNANVVVVTGTGINVAGTGTFTGNVTADNIITGSGTGGNITNANVISANTFLGNLANGTSSVRIPSANGNINLSAGGNANILVVSSTGVNVLDTLTIDTGVISVSSGNAGIFTSGINNINLGLSSNITLGSSSGNVTVQGNLSAANIAVSNTATITNIRVNDLYSNRSPIAVTTNTVVDSFPVSRYRSAKYTMRVNSDAGYQAVETLLIHDGSNSFVTIYGSLSTVGTDIVTLSTDINSGNVRLLASTSGSNVTVNLLGTYVTG